MKLVKMFETDVQTRSQYLKQINHVQTEEDLVNVPNMLQGEVTKILSQDCEERAALMFETFFRLTSVVFDVQSMVALLKREDLEAVT